jgi:CBS domain containing-hemolysin-like protein
MTVEEANAVANQRGFTRIPVYQGERENIMGYVMIDDLNSAQVLKEPRTQLKSLTKPIMFVREQENCLVLLTQFLKKRLHIAIIGDEYGGVSGLVTLEDLIETILGAEIVDETDAVVDLRKLARTQMQKRFDLQKEQEINEIGQNSFGTEELGDEDVLSQNETSDVKPVELPEKTPETDKANEPVDNR